MRRTLHRHLCGISRPNLDLSFSRGDERFDRRIDYSRTGLGVPMGFGPDGLLRFAPHNLCQRSYALHQQTNRLDDPTRWTANTVETGPDGAISGSILTAKAATSWGGQGVVYVQVQGLTRRTCAFVVKKGNHRYIAIRTGDAASGSPEKYNFYDWDTDTINNSAAPTMPITRTFLPNGCVRLSLTCAPSTSGSFAVALVASNGDVQTAPAGTEFVYVFSGQFVLGPDQPYIESTVGTEAFAPRITYNPLTGACEGALFEYIKTNYVIRSTDLTNASNWGTNSASGTCVATANAGTSPDGQNDAVLLTVTSAAYPRLSTAPAAPLAMDASTEYVGSLFVKAGSLDQICLWMRNGTAGTEVVQATFTFSTKTFTFAVGTLAGYEELPNGWFRIWVRGTRDATGSTGTLWITPGDGYTASSRTGTVYVWGPQVEQNDCGMTSYIPTGSATAVRGAEYPMMIGNLFNGWFKSNRPFTVLMRFKLRYYAYYQAVLCIAANATGEETTPFVGPTGKVSLDVKSGAVNQLTGFSELVAQPENSVYTICFRVAENNMSMISSLGKNVQDYDAKLPATIMDRISFMSNRARNNSNTYSSNLFEFKHWQRGLPDSQMRALVGV